MSNSYEIQADGMDSDREISAYLEPSVRELENKDLRFFKLLYEYHSSFTEVCICQNSSNIKWVHLIVCKLYFIKIDL